MELELFPSSSVLYIWEPNQLLPLQKVNLSHWSHY